MDQEIQQTLSTLDIKTAIEYFGITELLDSIGEEKIIEYLDEIHKLVK